MQQLGDDTLYEHVQRMMIPFPNRMDTLYEQFSIHGGHTFRDIATPKSELRDIAARFRDIATKIWPSARGQSDKVSYNKIWNKLGSDMTCPRNDGKLW